MDPEVPHGGQVTDAEVLHQALSGVFMATLAYALVEAVIRRTRWM